MMPGGGAGVAMHPGVPQQSSLTESLGSTIRLGVDLINAALAGGARVLNGMAGGTYRYEHSGHDDGGCGWVAVDATAAPRIAAVPIAAAVNAVSPVWGVAADIIVCPHDRHFESGSP